MSSLRLPKTLAELMSPEGQAALQQAEQLLNALQTTTVIIVDAAGQEHKGAWQVAGASAVVRVRL